MPFRDDEVRIDVMCGRYGDGRPRGWFRLHVTAGALRPLGLHPDQPTAGLLADSVPDWWYAAADRSWHRPPDHLDQPEEPRPRRRPHPS
jgi:hypothetical protein